MQDNLEESAERKACRFKRSWLGECSGIEDKTFGYSNGKPCILLKMNRVRFYAHCIEMMIQQLSLSPQKNNKLMK